VEAHVALLSAVEKLCESAPAGRDNRAEERKPLEDREVELTVGFDRLVGKMTGPADRAGDPAAPAAATATANDRGSSAGACTT